MIDGTVKLTPKRASIELVLNGLVKALANAVPLLGFGLRAAVSAGLAEIRVFLNENSLCRAICPELAGATVPLRDILRARNQRRRQLRTILRDRKKMVTELLNLKTGAPRAVIAEPS